MLELASAPQPKSAASPSPAALARHAAKDEAGFQGLLREAIESPAEGQHNARVKEATKPADRQERIQSEGKGVELGEGAAKADAAQQGAKDAPPPAANSASEAAEDTAPPLVPAVAAHDGTSEQGEAAAQTALSQLDAQTNLVAMQVAANAPAGQPVVDQSGLVPQAAAPSLAVKATLDAPEATALAAGPAQVAAAQVAPGAQVTGGPAKSVFIAQTKEALDTARNAEALTLLAKAVNNTESAAEVKLVAATETAEASLRLASLEAPKASSAKASSEGRVDGFAMAPTGFAPPDGMLQRTDAPLPSTAAREAPAPPPARQLAPVVVSLALGRGDEALTISLDPGELGRVEVSIGQGKEAGQVRIVAERPETLALLQRDQRDLDRALNQAGLGDMARSMSFSLASDQGRQQQQGSAHEKGNRASMIVGGLDGGRATPALQVPSRNATSLIDIAV